MSAPGWDACRGAWASQAVDCRQAGEVTFQLLGSEHAPWGCRARRRGCAAPPTWRRPAPPRTGASPARAAAAACLRGGGAGRTAVATGGGRADGARRGQQRAARSPVAPAILCSSLGAQQAQQERTQVDGAVGAHDGAAAAAAAGRALGLERLDDGDGQAEEGAAPLGGRVKRQQLCERSERRVAVAGEGGRCRRVRRAWPQPAGAGAAGGRQTNKGRRWRRPSPV